jgi:hypothetical protein
VAEDAQTLLYLRIGRRARGHGLRHPGDVLPGAVAGVGVQGRAGRKQDGTRTPRLTPLERRLLAGLEARVRPAWLLWPWCRAGAARLAGAAQALALIRDRQLWRERAATFEGYAALVFDFQRRDLDAIFTSGSVQRRACP